MEAVGVLIFFSIVGAFLCAKARFPGGAIVFSLVALVLFVATPAGSGLPGAVATFMSTLNDTTTPVLTDATQAGQG
jgi:ABC-type glycerol-3-phosphate transport system permease component